ncbi:low affinity immunoglobulin gamma Fc region receptor III-A-like [Pyxicephalus adspersus]|uniref:low affinity immunoglobulin gamma Fc region receptor III-A-like n=1 Tax=Pyxicephalus adspersus TaxID=30357 RepID=UPI003B593E59
MTPLLLIFLSYAAVESSVQVAVKPVVTFTPDWKDIFIYESVTITCHVGSTVQANQRYFWYKDTKPISVHKPSFTIQSADDSDIGEYQCRTQTSQKSDPAKLGVINYLLILQRPLVVYEGNPFTLRCHSYPKLHAMNTAFYKNRALLQFSVEDDNLHFTKVDHNASGIYQCTKQIYYNKELRNVSAEIYLYVKDRRKTVHSFPWIPVLLALLLTFIICPLLYKFRYKLYPLMRGCLQNYPVTDSSEPEEQNKTGEDVSYSSIETGNLQKACPVSQHQNLDYSIVYSHVNHVDSLDSPKITSVRTIYDVVKFE